MNGNPNITHLESRAVVRISGADCVDFLQNLISQDMVLATAGQPIFSAFLTPQGKYLFDFFVVPEDGQSFLLDVEAERRTEFISGLQRFHIRGDVKMEDLQDEYAVYAIWDGSISHAKAFTDPRLAALGQRLILEKGDTIETNVPKGTYRNHRYRFGVAEGGHEIAVGKATLLEINFDALNGVSFSKGCYLGQELTARMHHRALVKRRYLPFRFEGAAPKKFVSILHRGFEIGEVHAVGEEYGLGLFDLKAVQPFLSGTPLIHDGISYEVFVPEYLKPFVVPSTARQA